MKNFYTLACSILLSTVSFIANAQTDPEEKQYTNDIGFNTTFLLNGIINSGQTPFTLMYKKYNDNNNPLRLGIRLHANLSNINENSNPNFANSSEFIFSAVIGKEFQREISQKWIWYFGGDLIPSYQYSSWEYFGTNDYIQSTNDKTVALGFKPFLGVRFNINNRLYLSTEFSFGPTYSYSWIKKKDGYPPNILSSETQGSRFNFNMNPAYGLFLYYRF